MIEKFTIWLNQNQKTISTVSNLLAVKLSSEPHNLIDDLVSIEAWNARIGELLAEANAWLDIGIKVHLPEREGGMTEAERKAHVNDAVSDIRKVRDILESMGDAIKQKLILGESILRFERPTMTPEYKEPKPSLGGRLY